MKVYVCPESNEQGKFLGVIRAFPTIWKGRLLDVGCRTGLFREMLAREQKQVEYCGLDIVSPADIIANLENGLPFRDRSFDVVVALDVLEHVDRLHYAFDECCRVSRRYVLVTLPNAYELRARMKFVLGQTLSGKYGLPIEPPPDRHRWLFSLNDARRFVRHRAPCAGFKVADEGCLIGPRRALGGGKFLTNLWPNLFSPWFLCLLAREG